MALLSKHALIRLALQGLSATRSESWLPRADDAAGLVVTLHHVRPEPPAAFAPNALLAVTPEFLDRFIGHFSARGWRFVPIDEMLASSDPGEPRRIAVTLDDGYRNNLQHAWPVFQRHGTPFTIYVCPGFCDRSAELWWEALERIIARAQEIPAPGETASAKLSTRGVAEKQDAFRLWTQWLTTVADETRQRVAIRALAAGQGLDLSALAAELVMDWDEVRRIASDPLCTIGAHTMTHPALARLPQQEAATQMVASADRIHDEIGTRPTTIAFPYGYPAAASAREAGLAEEAGFAGSFTTQPGYIRTEGSRHGLPRVSLNGLYQDIAFTEVLLNPGLWKVRAKLRRQ
jgi:peptidoglycan/xylan/chitin deacetylase (PgdA/CDA1 family)